MKKKKEEEKELQRNLKRMKEILENLKKLDIELAGLLAVYPLYFEK
jgi:hypothetical protein